MNPTTVSHIFGKWTVSRRFTIITVMFLGVLLGLLGYTITTLYKDRSTAFLIEIAGRQQMLLQKHINEVFLASQGVATDYPSTRELIRSTFIALIEGGSVVLNPETGQRQTVSAAPTEELLTKLREQLAHFAQIVERADTFLVLGSDHPEFREQVQTLLAQNTARFCRSRWPRNATSCRFCRFIATTEPCSVALSSDGRQLRVCGMRFSNRSFSRTGRRVFFSIRRCRISRVIFFSKKAAL